MLEVRGQVDGGCRLPYSPLPVIGGQARRLTPEKQELLKQARSIFQIAESALMGDDADEAWKAYSGLQNVVLLLAPEAEKDQAYEDFGRAVYAAHGPCFWSSVPDRFGKPRRKKGGKA